MVSQYLTLYSKQKMTEKEDVVTLIPIVLAEKNPAGAHTYKWANMRKM